MDIRPGTNKTRDYFEDTIRLFFTQNPTTSRSVHADRRLKELLCFGYGANRRMGESSLCTLLDNNSETLFDEKAKLINAEEWLLQLDYAASKASHVRDFPVKRRNQVKQILIDLLPDISNIRFSTPTKENLKSSFEFETPFGCVSIPQLSLAYKSMVTW